MVLSEGRTISPQNEPQQRLKRRFGRLRPATALYLGVLLLISLLSVAGCGPSVAGTYTSGGLLTLDLKSGGSASVTMGGETDPCNYTVKGNVVSLTCQGQTGNLDLTIQSDGSLAPPAASPLPPFKKK
jgi:hypothetical protein